MNHYLKKNKTLKCIAVLKHNKNITFFFGLFEFLM